MTAARRNIEIEQGATWSLLLRYQNAAGTVVDLSGATARMQLRTNYDAPHPVISLTTENGRISIAGESGEITLGIAAEDTEALPAGLYVYDIELVLSGVVTRLLAGRATVSPEVTR